MPPRPWVKNQTVAVVAGGAAVIVGFVLLYDAWEGRGGKTPVWLRWLTVW